MKNIKDFGYYYNPYLKIIIIGFIKDYRLIGKVIKDKHYYYRVNYKYNNWDRSEFIYLGHGNPTEYYIFESECKPESLLSE